MQVLIRKTLGVSIMNQYEFTYEIPDDITNQVIRFLQMNGEDALAKALISCRIEYEDLGLAYYAGMKGDNWNKKALDITIEGPEKQIDILKARERLLKEKIQKSLRPTTTGYLVHSIDYLVNDAVEISLPDEQAESFDILSRDIRDALNKGEPTLVLDRLHTYSVRYLREICKTHGIPITDNKGDGFPLHSLAGSLSKYYRDNKVFQSDFAEQALKMSISTFEKYNHVRNQQSYAHDNEVLNNAEAMYVVSVVTATLTLLHEVENSHL